MLLGPSFFSRFLSEFSGAHLLLKCMPVLDASARTQGQRPPSLASAVLCGESLLWGRLPPTGCHSESFPVLPVPPPPSPPGGGSAGAPSAGPPSPAAAAPGSEGLGLHIRHPLDGGCCFSLIRGPFDFLEAARFPSMQIGKLAHAGFLEENKMV